MVTPPTGTVTFLFTDIEGSTRLWESQPERMSVAVERHDELLDDRFAAHGGHVFTTAGDSYSVAFDDPRDAVRAALDVQRGLTETSPELSDLRVRMGLHTGTAHERDGDYFGPTLSRAARIMSAGHGGQVLLSQATGDLVERDLPERASLRLLGEFRLRDLGAPEHLSQLLHPDLEDRFPPLRTLDNHVNNIPIELSSFVGRERELADIDRRLARGRLVTLTGVGGAGKTRLALQAAANTFDDFPDGVWVVELAAVGNAEELSRKTLDVMGLSGSAEQTPEGAARRVADHLATRRALLVLDNCEHLISSAAEFSDFLLRRCSDLKILATSREGLGVRGEHLIQVPSLSLPSTYDDADGFHSEAVELFAERAAAANSSFELTSENEEAVLEICRRLDGMPLAIELAAARVRLLRPDQIAERLSDAFRLLTGGARTALPRQQTLRATIEWSYDLLTDREQSVFARLAVFRGGFTLEAAETIVSGGGVDELDVFDILASLVDKSMVQSADRDGRFSLLETLRQYAQDRLAEAGQTDRWRERHARFFADRADIGYEATRDERQAEWFRQLERDHENFKAAVTWAVESGDAGLGARIAVGLYLFWIAHSHIGFAEETLTRLIELDRLEDAALAMTLQARAWMQIVRHPGNGLEDAERAHSIASRVEDDQLRARTAVALVTVLGFLGRYEEEQAAFTSAYEMGRRAGDEWVMGRLALNHGFGINLRAADGEDAYLDEASRWYEAAHGHFRASGAQLGQAFALTQRAVVRGSQGDVDGAIELDRQALALYTALGDLERAADAELQNASILIVHGRPDEAIDPALRALSLVRQRGGDTVLEHAIIAVARSESGDVAGGVAAFRSATEELPRAERRIAERLCVYVADFAAAGKLYESAAKLMVFAGTEEHNPLYVNWISDVVTRRVSAALNENLPGWRDVGAGWRDRPIADVASLIRSTLDELAAE